MHYDEYINKSSEWKLLRLKAYGRSNHKCEFCGKKGAAVHHIKYPKNYSEDSLDNLVVVCKKHHKLIHGIRGVESQELLEFCLRRGIIIDIKLMELIIKRKNFSLEKFGKFLDFFIKNNKYILTIERLRDYNEKFKKKRQIINKC